MLLKRDSKKPSSGTKKTYKLSLNGSRVLITGSNGFIGKHIVKRLVKEGAEIYGIGRHENELKEYSIKYYKIDIRDLGKLRESINEMKPNIIFHLAALINHSKEIDLIEATYGINLQGTVNMLLATQDINYDLFIYANTSELYGNENNPPFNEDMKIKAMSPYSASKLGAEIYCNLFSEGFNKPIVTFRIPIPYGPAQRGKMFIPDLMDSIKENKEFMMTKGEQGRDFIYIDDIVDAYILCCNKSGVKGIFNLGSGKETILKEIIELLKKQVKINVKFNKPYRKNEIWHYYLDISKLKKEVNWEPKITLEEGLKKTLDWWKDIG